MSDSGQNITVEVTPVALSGTAAGVGQFSTPVIVTNSLPTVSNVVAFDTNGGLVAAGDALSVRYDYLDVDGDAQGSTTFQWLRNGLPINGAISNNYTLTSSDTAQSISVDVYPVAIAGLNGAGAFGSNSLVVNNSPPVASSLTFSGASNGNFVVGDTITANYVYSDVDDDAEATSTIRWFLNGTEITGENTFSYTLKSTDSGASISFAITPQASSGMMMGTEVFSSQITTNNTAPIANAVSILDVNAGDVVVGDKLTARYTFNDNDGDVELDTQFRWFVDGVIINNATDQSYTVRMSDNGKNITFEVTPQAATGVTQGLSVISNSLTVINSAPTARQLIINDINGGAANVGDVLSAQYLYNDVDGDLEDLGATQFSWQKNGTPINGANTSTYTVVSSDIGEKIVFSITPMAISGVNSNQRYTSSSLSITNAPPNAINLNISDDNAGTIVVGTTLTAQYTYTDLENDNEGTSTFRWLRNGVLIAGANTNSYTLVAADGHQNIAFEVIPVAVKGTTLGTATQSTSIEVADTPPVVTNVVISSSSGAFAQQGDLLSVSYNYFDADGDPERANGSNIKWRRDNIDVSRFRIGNTTYLLLANDIPADIIAVVEPLNSVNSVSGAPVTSSVFATGLPPKIINIAGYVDANSNRIIDIGDQIVVTFDQSVVLNNPSINDFTLAVSGDSFGSGASVSAGNVLKEVIITLGSSPVLTLRHDYDDTVTSSGIGLSQNMATDRIEGLSGIDAIATTAVDIAPSFVAMGVILNNPNIYEKSVAISDINNDGILDIVKSSSAVIRVYTGLDNAQYSTPNTVSTLNNAFIYLEDVDRDGDKDIVAISELSLHVFTNDGSGSFTPLAQTIPVTLTGFYKMYFNDVDQDGDVDIILSERVEPTLIFINDGSGQFSDSGQRIGVSSTATTPSNINQILIGDLNQDGYADLVEVNGFRESRLYFNDGNGVFIESSSLIYQSGVTGTGSLGDIDNDGDLDILLSTIYFQNNDIYDVIVLHNDGSGNFPDVASTPISLINVLSFSSILRLESLKDMDIDGDLDLVTHKNIYLNNGTGLFDLGALSYLQTGTHRPITIKDLDNDSDLDIYKYSSVDNFEMYINTASMSFSGIALTNAYDLTPDLFSSQSVELTDIDNDGDLDVIEANLNHSNRIYTNDGNGQFIASNQPALTLMMNNSLSVKSADFDNDGDIDLVFANNGENTVFINTAGAFANSGLTLGSNNSKSISVGDMNKDGKMDIVVVNSDTDPVIYHNNFTFNGLSFNSSLPNSNNKDSRSSQLGDVDGDGDLDLVVANYNQANMIYLNTGSGVFNTSVALVGNRSSTDVALGDIDQDGDLDLIVANNNQANRVFNNDGSGTFSDTNQTLGTSSSREISLIDLDADGDLDLVETNFNQANNVYLNNGLGIFTLDTSLSLGSASSTGIALGDLDQDGDIDAVISNFNQENRVYLNQ